MKSKVLSVVNALNNSFRTPRPRFLPNGPLARNVFLPNGLVIANNLILIEVNRSSEFMKRFNKRVI